MDRKIEREQLYRYLCHVEEIKVWLQTVLNEELPSSLSFEERLRNGVSLAKLAHFINPKLVPLSKIYDIDEKIYFTNGLCFKHMENINHFLLALQKLSIPQLISLETTDIYNRNNMPKVMFCLHILISHLNQLHNTPQIESLVGKITFADEEIDVLRNEFKEQNRQNYLFDFLDTSENVKIKKNIKRKIKEYTVNRAKTDDAMGAFPLTHAEENKENIKIDKDSPKKVDFMKKLNHAVEMGLLNEFIEAVHHPALGIDKAKLKSQFIPLYLMELKEDKMCQGTIQMDGIKSSINVLYSIALITEAIDTMCPDKTWSALNSSIVVFQSLDYDLKDQYLKALSACKRFIEIERCDCAILSYMNIQDCIDLVNERRKSLLQEEEQEEIESDPLNPLNSLEYKILEDDSSFYTELMVTPHNLNTDCINMENAWLLQHYLKDCLTGQNSSRKCSNLTLELLEEGLSYIQSLVATVQSDIKWLQKLNTAVIQGHSERVVDLIISLPGVNEDNANFIAYLLIAMKKQMTGQSPWIKHKVGLANITINLTTEEYFWSHTIDADDPCYISLSDVERTIRTVNSKHLVRRFCKLQSHCRGYLVRKQIKSNMERSYSKIDLTKDPAVIIQAAWRGYRVRKLFKSILSVENVNYKNLRAFLSLIDVNTADYKREIHLQALRGQVAQSIRTNTELMEQINKMDITIGLLVQNKISLMDAVEESKRLGIGVKGLKSLRADNRRILEGYEHLFYTLQTSPHYLAKLLFCLPQNRSSKFLQSVIFSLYNFGANQRNEYLLLKLFQHALREEIRNKFTNPSEVITGNPLVLKMVVNYARLTSGHNALRHILGQLLIKVLNNKEMTIETNPVSIYNHWRNETEMNSGKSFDLPHTVSYDEALSHQEVVKRVNKALDLLKSYVRMFLKRIVSTRDCLPYGLRFIAKELKLALMLKFPNTSLKEIMKVVGNMLYYQFINSAIVAPDAFDIISLPAGKTLSSDERHSLASIAKILQFAAAKKGFGEESRHLMCLNSFIIECHDVFKEHFLQCCEVEDLDVHFSINEYTEATLIASPIIYISLQEILEIHTLLNENKNEIAPDENDPLKELLNDLEPVPTLSQLSGYGESAEYNERQIAKTEICIKLKNKFEGLAKNNTDLSKLFVRTKEILVMVFPFLSGHTLPGALRIESTKVEEKLFAERNPEQGTLKECKSKLKKYLNQLCDQGVVSKDNSYQCILNSIAADISNKNKYRKQQSKDLENVEATLKSLKEKTAYYQDQIVFYQQYIERCLENLNSGKRNIHVVKRTNPNEKFNSKHVLKYTGTKLFDKGILISIDGLSPSQYKHVLFEIRPSDHNGIFDVTGKFMGVEVENIEIDMQDLLQLQYNGVGVKNIFGKAKININLLLFLLNAKYYKKTK